MGVSCTKPKVVEDDPVALGWKEFRKKTIQSIQNDSNTSNRFRQWLKKANDELTPLFLCLEAISKRSAVYVSGQKCGDDKEKGMEILESHYKTIVEKHFGNLKSVDPAILERARNGNPTELNVFEELSNSCVQQLQQYLNIESYPK